MKISYVLPEKTLGNGELAKLYPGWSEEKIFVKTGIRTRHVVSDGETALDMAERAARKLMDEYGINAEDVDFVLLCTQSPEYKLPTSACMLQSRLGLKRAVGALDFNLGCSGYIYGLSLAKGLIQSGSAKNVLLVTSETYSRYVHPMDKSARTIFGDGASATLIDCEAAKLVGAFSFGTDGGGARNLIVETGGARMPYDPDAIEDVDDSGNRRTRNNLFMNGVEIFNFTLEVIPETMRNILEKNSLMPQDIDLYVFHQANAFMLNAIRKTNLISASKFYIDMEDTGNTVSSTIPIALKRAETAGRLVPGMKVLSIGFGVGLSWGGTVFTWK